MDGKGMRKFSYESYGDNVDSKEQEVFVTKDEVAQAFSHFSYERVYGRTGKGEKGMHHFLRTHECSALCHLLMKGFRRPHKRGIKHESTTIKIE